MKFPFQLIAESDFDVVGFGTNAVDHLIRVADYPVFNSKVELTSHTTAAGGEVASAMVGLQRLGLRTAYAGRFGDDAAGKLGLTSLGEEGVDVAWAQTVPGAKTQIAFIIIDEKTGERTIIWHRDPRLAFTPADAPVRAAKRAKILHMTPHDTAACIAMANEARRHGVIVSLDIDKVLDGVDELLPLVDVCITSAEFPARPVGTNDRQDAFREMAARYGCPVIGMTLGESGSAFLCGDAFFEAPGFAVPGGCIDTTGAGDAFRAGFLFGLLSGSSPEDSARIANAVAALKCRAPGARAGLPFPDELKLLL